MGLVGTAEGPISWQQQKNQKLSIINVSTGKYATGAKILKLKKRRIRFFLYTKYSTSFLETSLRRSEKWNKPKEWHMYVVLIFQRM